MKKMRSVVIVIVVLVVMSVFAAVALADSGAKAAGQGKFYQGRTFAFQAQEREDGSVDGSGLLQFPNDLRIHYAIDCLNVDGSMAIMSGTMTSVDLPGVDVSAYVGGPFYFRVIDNGEGDGNPADQMTYFLFDLPEYAAEFPGCDEVVTEIPLYDENENPVLDENGNQVYEDFVEIDIIAGNIQVRE